MSDIPIGRRIFREIRGHRRHIVLLFAVSLIATPVALLNPIPLKIAVDSVLGTEPVPAFLDPVVSTWFSSTTGRLLLFAALLQVTVVLVNHLQFLVEYYLQTVVGERISLDVRARLLAHAQRLSFGYHDRTGTADTIFRIQSDANAVQHLAIFGVIPVAVAVVTLVSMVVVIFTLDATLALVALVVAPLFFLYNRLYKRRMRPHYRRTRQLESSAQDVVQEVLTSHRVVKAFGREEDEEERFTEKSAEGMRARIRLSLAEGWFGLLVNLTTGTGTALVLYIGVQSVLDGTLTLGELLLVMTYLTQLYGPLRQISTQLASLQGQVASAERVFELLDEPPNVVERADPLPLDRAEGAVEFRHVSFAYDAEDIVLQDVNLKLRPGARLGIVGRTGAGKSTLAALLMRFYDPSMGAIYLDGRDVREYRLADLRRQFSIVLQEPLLFSTTVAANIAYARPGATHAEIVAAAKAAGAHEFIAELPLGYQTVVDERGMRLSGGERQRVALARAFLKDAPILVLDEPTSSVDVRTEAAIMETMEELMEGRTTLMIAHRLTTLARCDAVIEVRDGRVGVRASVVGAP